MFSDSFGSRSVIDATGTCREKLRKRKDRFQVPRVTRVASLNDRSVFREDIGEEDWANFLVVGECMEVEKPFFRLTAPPDPSTVRPVPVLKKALSKVYDF